MNLRMIDLAKIRADYSYQREPKKERINAIAKKWDDMKANIIHVSYRNDGFYYVMDGNHTRLAAEQVGKTELPCRIYENLSVKDEATIFTELNNSQQKPKFAEMLKAKATAGSQKESDYLRALNETNVPYTLSQSNITGIKCHSSLFNVFKKTTYNLFTRALRVAMNAVDGRKEMYSIGLFPGMVSLVVCYPEIDDVRFINVVRKTTASRIRENADVYKRAIIAGNSSTNYYRRAYIDIYNKGLKSRKIEQEHT